MVFRENNMASTNDTKEQQTRKSFAPGAADSRRWTTDTCQEKARKPIGPRQKGWFVMICLFAASTVISWHTILWAMHPFTCFFITGLIHWLMFFFVQYTTLDTHYYISVMRPSNYFPDFNGDHGNRALCKVRKLRLRLKNL